MGDPVKVAFNGIRNIRVSGWELWPTRKSLDGSQWLCRWCAKPLSNQRTSYCSDTCEKELQIRATIPGIRQFAINRANGKCEACGINLEDLKAAFEWYRNWFDKLPYSFDRGVKKRWDNGGWPVLPDEFRAAAGYKSNGHLWEVNHIHAIAEGGDPVDPSNLEVLCLKCHRKHSKSVMRRLASEGKQPDPPKAKVAKPATVLLDDHTVKGMRYDYFKLNLRPKQIASKWGVSYSRILAILNKQTYTEIDWRDYKPEETADGS